MHYKKCDQCGNDNDPLLTNCLFCKSPLPTIDINSIPNEQLVLNAGEWIGKLKDGFYTVRTHARTSFYDNNVIAVRKAEIQGYALQYLSLIQVRAVTNTNLNGIYADLKRQYEIGVASDDAPTKALKKVGKVFLIMGIFMIILILIMVISFHYMGDK